MSLRRCVRCCDGCNVPEKTPVTRKTIIPDLFGMDYDEVMARLLGGRTVNQTAKDLRMAQQTLQAWVSKTNLPTPAGVHRIVHATGLDAATVNLAVSAERRRRKQSSVTQPPAGYVSLAPLDVPVRAGAGAAAHPAPAVLRHVDVLESWATALLGSDLSRVRLVTVRGDSMQPTLSAGDVLFVDAGQRAYSTDGLYVLSRGGNVFVKRLQMRSRGVLAVISDNAVYPVELLADRDLDDVVICGRVLASWSLRQLS
ncbi:S24 family peptidase [Ralstonia pseudosolanacearum]